MHDTLFWEVGTFMFYTYRMGTITKSPPEATQQTLVHEMLERIADKWTLLVIEELAQAAAELRFTRLAQRIPGVSQKMLTKTLRQLERDGLVTRRVHPVIPPHVDYALTPRGESLGEATCGIWLWAEKHGHQVLRSRQTYDDARALRPETGERGGSVSPASPHASDPV
jgi:DNA-binding HxlR family transcriptional regulator